MRFWLMFLPEQERTLQPTLRSGRRRAKRHLGHAEEEAFGRWEAAIMDGRFQANEILCCQWRLECRGPRNFKVDRR